MISNNIVYLALFKKKLLGNETLLTKVKKKQGVSKMKNAQNYTDLNLSKKQKRKRKYMSIYI